MPNLPYQPVLLSALSLGALLAIAYYFVRLPPSARLPRLALALVLGGAIGNLIDRVRMGYVVGFRPRVLAGARLARLQRGGLGHHRGCRASHPGHGARVSGGQIRGSRHRRRGPDVREDRLRCIRGF